MSALKGVSHLRGASILAAAATLGVLAAAAALAACEQVEEVLPTVTPAGETALLTATPTAASSPTTTPSATLLPTATPTVAGCPEGVYPPMTMTLTGPAEARPGQQVTYTLSYELPGVREAIVHMDWAVPGGPRLSGDDLPFVSAQRVSGTGDSSVTPISGDGKLWFLDWRVSEGAGALQLTFQIPDRPPFQSFRLFAYVSGVCAPRSNPATTAIVGG